MAHTATDALTTAQVCDRFGCDKSTLSRWVREGFIRPAMKLPGPTGAFLFAAAEVARVEPLAAGRLARRPKSAPAA